MSANKIIETYYCSTNIKIPAGVTSIEINPIYPTNWVSTAVTVGVASSASTIFKTVDGQQNVSGYGASGQLGSGFAVTSTTNINSIGGAYFKFCASGPTSYALGNNGIIFSTGNNSNGELGDTGVLSSSSFIATVGGIKYLDVNACQITTNAVSCFGISDKSKLYSWGVNTYGQLGVGDVVPRSSPVAVLGNFNISNFCSSPLNSFAIDTSNLAYSWGSNVYGQLGVGDVVPRSSPIAVLGGINWAKLISTGTSSHGLSTGGIAYSFGLNSNGQLGVGDVIPRSSPVAVLGGLVFKDIFFSGSQASSSIFGITKSGKLYSWGYNVDGQLGVGDVIPRSSPVAVLGGIYFKKVYANGYSFFGIDTSNNLYAWGLNNRGQLGVGDLIPRSSPVAVLGGLKWFELGTINANGQTTHGWTYGVTTSGKMYSWGDNTYGQLGLGDTVSRSSPVAILGSNSVHNFNNIPLSINKSIGQFLKIPVTPGNTYTLRIAESISFFDSIPLACGKLEKIEITYYV